MPGIATDLNHIDTRAKVCGYLAEDDGLQKALYGADYVVVTAGIARKPGMTRDGKFLCGKYSVILPFIWNMNYADGLSLIVNRSFPGSQPVLVFHLINQG